MIDRYAVFGNPVAHSQSPWIHARFAELTAQDLRYDRVEVPLDGFADALQAFIEQHGKGLNVTVPFKEEAWRAVAERSARAESAGAVNTIAVSDDGLLYGDNTDGVGLVRDLCRNNAIPLAGQRILILGAGGAVRGILGLLAAERPAHLVIANRTVERARALLPLCEPVSALACGFGQLAGTEPFDLVINGTSTGLSGDMPDLPAGLFSDSGAAYDLVYGARPTPFMEWSRRSAAQKVLDGLGMLVEQAAESFHLWRGVRPETDGVIKELRQRLS